MNKIIDEEAIELITTSESRLGVPDGFFRSLPKEDDWSFVIKLHAVFEAAATSILSKKLGEEIEEVLARLELGNVKTGKMAFIKKLGLMSTWHFTFIQHLSTLRNMLVHKVENVSFSFTQHVENLDKNQFKAFVKAMGFNLDARIETNDGTVISCEEFIRQNTKNCIWLSAADVLACLELEEQLLGAKAKQQLLEIQVETLKSLKINDSNFRGLFNVQDDESIPTD